jgi:primosomal protein N' (replication factor Y)
MKKSLFVDVALPISLFETYLYKIDLDKYKFIKNEDELVGRRVLVPFRNTKHVGIVRKVLEEKPEVRFDIKEIEQIPDKYPVYSKEYVEIIEKLSDYYVSPIGMSLYYGMPEPLRWDYDTVKKKWNFRYLNLVYYPVISNLDSVSIKSEKAKRLLDILIARGEMSLEEIKELGFSKQTVNYLEKRGLIKTTDLYFNNISTELKSERKIYSYGKEKLKTGIFLYNSERADRRLNRYISLLANVIYEGKGGLIIFPNIQVLKEAYRKLKPIFGEKLYIYFDGLKADEKVKTWFNLKNGKGLICLGTLSSIFIPIRDLSLLIIEEEHSTNYKMIRTPRFDIRRFGIEIYNKFKSLTLVFASSVPSVETVYLHKRGFVKSFSRKNILSPIKSKVEIENRGYFNLEGYIENSIDINKKNLIVVNRTGVASLLRCGKCGYEVECPRCKVPLRVFKRDTKYLKCYICGKSWEYFDRCVKCDSKLIEYGFGIEKIKKYLEERFKGKISYIAEREKDTPIKITTTINNKELLVGDFDRVINIFPDVFLQSGYKGDEEYFRNVLLSYLKSKEKLTVLTNYDNSAIFDSLNKKNLNIFYNAELEKRKLLDYPPFANYILLTFEGKNLNLDTVKEIFNNWLKKYKLKNIEYEGPRFSKVPYAREKFRYSILLKNFKRKEYLKDLYTTVSKKKIKLTIDVSPRNI